MVPTNCWKQKWRRKGYVPHSEWPPQTFYSPQHSENEQNKSGGQSGICRGLQWGALLQNLIYPKRDLELHKSWAKVCGCLLLYLDFGFYREFAEITEDQVRKAGWKTESRGKKKFNSKIWEVNASVIVVWQSRRDWSDFDLRCENGHDWARLESKQW